jgi:hypothetical protein
MRIFMLDGQTDAAQGHEDTGEPRATETGTRGVRREAL